MGLSKEQVGVLQKIALNIKDQTVAEKIKQTFPEAFEPQPVEFKPFIYADNGVEIMASGHPYSLVASKYEIVLGDKFNWIMFGKSGYQMLAAYEKTDKYTWLNEQKYKSDKSEFLQGTGGGPEENI